jgi:hypothetical protein
MTDNTRDLLVRGIAAAKAKEIDEARFFLEWVLRLDPPPDEHLEALYWLSEASDDARKQRDYLEEILARRPTDYRARRSLAILDGRLDPQAIIDPDQPLPTVGQAEEDATAQRFVCSKCGGRLVYTPDGQSLTCEFCDQKETLSNPVEPGRLGTNDEFTVAMATSQGHSRPVTIRSIECHACGAKYLLAPQALSTNCPYCTSIYVLDTSESNPILPPDQIIPLKINLSRAQSILDAWFESRRIPATSEVAVFQGRYLPVWNFSLTGTVSWPTRTIDGEPRDTDESQRFVSFEGILIPATRSFPEQLLEGNLQFDLSDIRQYEAAFLANWPAETYQLTLSDASLKARWEAIERIRNMALGETGLSKDDLEINSMDLIITAFDLLLLPVWFAQFQHEGEHYSAYINGQNGRLLGELPRKKGNGDWLSRLLVGK